MPKILEDLVEQIGKQNIAKDVDKKLLDDLGDRVFERFTEDWDSMKDWRESVDEGLELMKQEYKPKSTPWQNASNFKSPIMSEASIAFGDKASLEILRSKNLVKSEIIGRDVKGKKKELSERVGEVMNYQVNHQMTTWREDQKRMLYVAPNVGAMFKKTVFDPLQGHAASHIISYPDFAVNQATTSLETCRSFTQILDVDKNGMIERVNAEIWLDIDIYTDKDDGDEGSNEKAGTKTATDNEHRFLEQQCFADLDEDGYEEPYIVTIHEQTRKVLRIVPRFNRESFIIKTPEGRTMSLVQAIREETKALKQSGQPLPEVADVKKYKLVRVEPAQQLTKYGFIPAPDGTFLDLGYAHLLGAIVQAINTTTNQLTDSGTLRNMGGGWLAKGFRKKMGPSQFKPGEYKSTNIAARDLQSGVLNNPNPEPSQVLFALNEKLEKQGRSFAAIVDISGQIAPNTAPTTALAMIQEALISTSALMGRILDGMSNEFQILFKLDGQTFDPELYKLILDDPEADSDADFNNDSLDIVPTASPEMSSKLQRIQLATVEMEAIPLVIQAGGNPGPIVKNYFERIGSDNIEEIFPEEPTDAQAEETARFTEAQEMQNKIAMKDLELKELQTEILMREQDRLDADTRRKIEETNSKMKVDLSTVILNLEKAESEEVKNQVSVYTANMQGHIDQLGAISSSINSRGGADLVFDPETGRMTDGRA